MGLRMPGSTEKDMAAAVTRGELVLTWPIRGTLHYVPAEDAAWMLKTFTPKVVAGSAGRYRQQGLDGSVFSKCAQLLEGVLAGGRSVTRTEVYQLFEKNGVSTANYRGLHILGHLAQTGRICLGPRRDKQPTFVLLDEWVPNPRRLAGDEAVAELTRRYFTSHGPATAADFAWWSGLNNTDAKRGIELAGNILRSEEIKGTVFWSCSKSEPALAVSRPKAHLLPAFDEFTVAYKSREVVLSAAFASRVNAGGGFLSPVMVYGGKVVGTWRRKLASSSVGVELQPFKTLSQTQQDAFGISARRYGTFLGLETKITEV